MQTRLSQHFLNSTDGQIADRILRSCVHCGFCNATCPTYQLLGDELDGPRGRIYLIKQMLEGHRPGKQTLLHLDRCLTCRNCETTCPSGVQYSQLLNIGREVANQQVRRRWRERTLHFLLRKLLLSRRLFKLALRTGQAFRPLLPQAYQKTVPATRPIATQSVQSHTRKVLLVEGCVQPTLQPNIDQAARIIFDKLSIECMTVPAGGCCGSLSHHLNAKPEALAIIKKNIDCWWPLIEQKDIEAITMTASGCGVAIKEYEQLLANDPDYANKARIVSALYKDPVEIIETEDCTRIQCQPESEAIIAFHPPCTLQHGMQLTNKIEPLLQNLGYTIKPFSQSHLCCGSAGTYSITQKSISRQLLTNKLNHIQQVKPDIIATANIGCQLHLQSGTDIPVRHWLELLC